MAISNQAAITFCNTYLRPLADKLAQSHNACVEFAALYAAKGMSGLIPNDPSQNVLDGALLDGRTVINGQDVSNLLNVSSGLYLNNLANNSTFLNQILKVAVNL